jgi:hypothetical protein
MQCNVGGFDSALRTLASVGALAFAVTGRVNPAARALALVIAAVEALTVVTRHCPLNQALGINTCRGETPRSPLDAIRADTGAEYLEEHRPEHYAG